MKLGIIDHIYILNTNNLVFLRENSMWKNYYDFQGIEYVDENDIWGGAATICQGSVPHEHVIIL